MKGARIRADGRKTRKEKPGPKPTSIQEASGRHTLIFLHALIRFPRMKTLFRDVGKAPGLNRNLARLAIAVIEGEAIATRPGAYVIAEKLDTAADALVKHYRAIIRDRARQEDRAFLDRGASLLFDALRPKRASLPDHPILSTPDGIIGGRAWAARRAMKVVDKHAPVWVQVAQAGATYLADANIESRRIAERARSELSRDGFPISEVLKRLNLL